MSKQLKVGSVVFSTWQGLGVLAKDFYDHGVVTDVAVIRHGKHPENDDWYPRALRINDLHSPVQLQALEAFAETVDVMLFFETPFHWPLIDHCRRKGVKTALMTMYECMHEVPPAQPDLYLCPSKLDLKYYPKGVLLPVPVDAEKVVWKLRERAQTFIHNAGHGGLKGRNGTEEVIRAYQHVRSPARIIIRRQPQFHGYKKVGQPMGLARESCCIDIDPKVGKRLEIRVGTIPYADLYTEGDVFLFPERHNGLSLPLQEARAAGMLVMAGDRFPMNDWLPREPLIPVSGYTRDRVSPQFHEFDRAEYDLKIIAAKIDEWHNADISEYSKQGREWAESMSWSKWRGEYLKVLGGI